VREDTPTCFIQRADNGWVLSQCGAYRVVEDDQWSPEDLEKLCMAMLAMLGEDGLRVRVTQDHTGSLPNDGE